MLVHSGGADLHIHTKYSDGSESPTVVVELAANLNLCAVAITDHDTIEGIPEALAAAEKYAIRVIPGVEISTRIGRIEIHIVGLFIESGRQGLVEFLRTRNEERITRIYEMTAKLRALGVKITPEEVFALARGGSPGRMHVAAALVRAGQVSGIQEAFARFIGDDGPAYVARKIVTPAEAVRLIRSAGGVPILAHPGLTGHDELIPDLVRAGVMGIEVYYPTHTPQMVEFYLRIAERYGLLISGGSDFHGRFKADVTLGQVRISTDLLERLAAAAQGKVHIPDAV